jgi:NADPH:quinone reductase-like Zn-dependent oxidoreductase
LAVDALGGSTLYRLAECLRPDSALVVYGSVNPRIEPFPYPALLYNNCSLHGFWLYKWFEDNPQGYGSLADLLVPLLEEGKIGAEIALEKQVAESFQAMLADSKLNPMLSLATIEEAEETVRQLSAEEKQDGVR